MTCLLRKLLPICAAMTHAVHSVNGGFDSSQNAHDSPPRIYYRSAEYLKPKELDWTVCEAEVDDKRMAQLTFSGDDGDMRAPYNPIFWTCKHNERCLPEQLGCVLADWPWYKNPIVYLLWAAHQLPHAVCRAAMAVAAVLFVAYSRCEAVRRQIFNRQKLKIAYDGKVLPSFYRVRPAIYSNQRF